MRKCIRTFSAVVLVCAVALYSSAAFAAPTVEPLPEPSAAEETGKEPKKENATLEIEQSATFDFDAWERTGDIHRQEFSGDHYMKGLFATISEYFNVGDWEVRGARLVLKFATTQLMRARTSDFTVYLNEQPLYSGNIPETDGKTATLTVELPVEKINTGTVNSIKISAYLRGNDEDPCVDYATNANWINIFEESRVEVAYTPLYSPVSIGALYAQLSSIDALEKEESGIFVSGSSEGALTAFAWSAAGLSGNAKLFYTDMDAAKAESAAIKAKSYALYISDYNAILSEVAALLSAEQKKAAEEGAIAAVLKYGGTDVLLVAGDNAAALANAGKMLANEKYMAQLDSKYVAITASDDFEMEKYRVDQYTKLTATGAYVNGSYRQTASFYVEWPANRSVTSSSELSLDIRYSENIDFSKALVSVYVNDIPMGSRLLDKKNANGMNIMLRFPEDIDIAGSFSLKVAFDLEAEDDDWCRLSPEEMPWGYVAPTSMLKLASMDVQELLFDNYPSPFVRDGSVNNLTVVLPDDIGEGDIKTLHSIFAGLGRFFKDNNGTLRVCAASEAGDISQDNVIFIGAARKNAGADLEGAAWQLAYSGKTLESSSEKLRIDPAYGAALGMCELIVSPFDKEYAVMMVSGSTDLEMTAAAEYLCDVNLLWKLSGDAYIISPNEEKDEVSCYTFADLSDRRIDEDKDKLQLRRTINIIFVAGLVLVICATALIAIILKKRREKS